VVMIVHPRKLHWTISLWATFGCLPHIHINVTLVNILYVNKGRGVLQYHNSSSTPTKALSKKLHLVIHKSPIKKVTPRHPRWDLHQEFPQDRPSRSHCLHVQAPSLHPPNADEFQDEPPPLGTPVCLRSPREL